MTNLHSLAAGEAAIYEASVGTDPQVRKFVVSTPESRKICNDPLVAGTDYTRSLTQACTKVLRTLRTAKLLHLEESETVVLHILRGGLNFGLREALADAFGFRHHGAAFISAQRARKHPQSEEWIITESEYRKLSLHQRNHIVLGDVVATGASLEHALHKLVAAATESSVEITGVTFFTIGGPRSHEILETLNAEFKTRFPQFRGAQVVYLEGIFSVPTKHSTLRVKIDGTDLARVDALMTPEFIESQYENPAYPLERCTIYDAGSRAFDLPEYFNDVEEYWQQVGALARDGMSFKDYLAERAPLIEASRFKSVHLEALAQSQLLKIPTH